MKSLALLALAVIVSGSGCATARHLNQPESVGNSPIPTSEQVSTNPQTLPNATPAVLSGLRARNWHIDEEARPWLAELNVSSHLTLAPSDSTAGGGSENSAALNPFSKAYGRLLLDDVKATFTAPADWNTRDWLVFGGVVASVGTVAVFDKDINKAIQRNRNGTVDDIFKGVQGFGNEYAPGVIGAFYLGGMVFNDPEAKAVALDATSASLIASGLVLYPIKYAVGRARPGANVGAYHFKPFSGSDSFPSGHTTEAFALATVIAEHYDSIWIDVGCYGLASAVGYARLDLNYHWASDVLAGAAIGTFVGHVVVHVNHNRWGMNVQPLIGSGIKGAQLSWSF